MKWARFRCLAAGLCSALACGTPPEPPGAVSSRESDPAGSDTVAVSGARPSPDTLEPEPVAPEPIDAGSAPADGEMPGSLPNDSTGERTFTACTSSSLLACDYIYIAMREAGSDLCVQLTIDNCGDYQRPGFAVDVPLSWRVSSGSAGVLKAGCVPGEYEPASVPIIAAEGEITWNDTTRRPSAMVIDLTVEPSRSPGAGLDAGPITLSTRELVGALPNCED